MRSKPRFKPAPRDRTGTAAIAAALLVLALAPSGLPVEDASVEGMPVREPDASEVLELRASTGAPRPLVDHLAQRYRIAPVAAEETANAAYLAASRAGVDPLLVLAVIGVESSFNPAAESSMGAKGLMQIMPHYHRDTLIEHGGESLLFEPLTNVAVGTRILGEYIERAGSLEAGLQSYNGARQDASARYAQKVIAEMERLKRVAPARMSEE